MKLASYLKRSPFGVYFFRLVIPRRLRAAYGGKGEIKRSLRTKDPALARRYAYILSASLNSWSQQASRVMADTPDEKRKVLELLRDELVKEANFKLGFRYGDMTWTESGYGMSRSPQAREDLQALVTQLESVDRALASVGGPTAVTTEQPVGSEWSTRLSVAAQTHLALAKKGTAAPKTILALEKSLDRFKSWIAGLANQPGTALKSVTGASFSKLESDPVLSAIEQEHVVAYMHHMFEVEIGGAGRCCEGGSKSKEQEDGAY